MQDLIVAEIHIPIQNLTIAKKSYFYLQNLTVDFSNYLSSTVRIMKQNFCLLIRVLTRKLFYMKI